MARKHRSLVKQNNLPGMQSFHSVKNAQQANLLIIKQVKKYSQVSQLTRLLSNNQANNSGNVLQQLQQLNVQGFEENTLMIFQQSWQGEEVHQVMNSMGSEIQRLLRD